MLTPGFQGPKIKCPLPFTFQSNSFYCEQSVQSKNSAMLINPSCICSRICSAHVSSLLLSFSVIIHLGLFVTTTSQTKRAYSCVRTNNCKHQTQNEQCHDHHTTNKEIKRNLPSTHFENTNKRSNQKLYNLKVSARYRNILTTVSI